MRILDDIFADLHRDFAVANKLMSGFGKKHQK